MTTIILHGYLRDLHPEPIQVEANSAAEAIQSLSLIPALKRGGKRHMVRAENFDSVDALFDKRNVDVIHLHPVAAGAGGNGGLGQIILGIVIIVIAWWNPAGWSVGGSLIMSQGAMYMAGGMMVLGGVLQMLSPQPSLSGNNDEKSRYLGNGRNTVAIGTRIPMIYGRRRAFGQYISFNINAGDFDSSPADWYSSTFTDYGDATHSAAPPAEPIDDPQSQYKQPESVFTGLTYPPEMDAAGTTYFNFDAVQLTKGEWDINFRTGQIVHVYVAASGLVSSATLRGGMVYPAPAPGTPITFSQNYD